MRQQSPRRLDHSGMRRADDGADRGEPALADELLVPTRPRARDVLPDRPSVRERQVLDVAAAGVRGLEDDETPRRAPVVREERLERVAAHVRARFTRRPQLRSRGRERGGVGAGRRRDVASLRVGDHEQARPPVRSRTHSLKTAQPARPLRLEERRLRLDRDRDFRDCVDDPATETSSACRPPPASGGGRASGSSPTQSGAPLRSTAAASRSAK